MPSGYRRRYSGLFRTRGYNNWSGFYGGDVDPNGSSDGLAGQIRASMRRRKALKKCRKFLTKQKYILTLRNQNVILVFDSKNKTISCIDNKVKGRAATVVWAEQINNPVQLMFDYNDNIFEQTFDNICISFSESANYTGILDVLKGNFQVQETQPKAKTTPVKPESAEVIPFKPRNIEKLDINSADEQSIAKLPGISVIIAKKIIKYRDTHRGFKALEEFYREMKIKPHFQKQLDNLICAIPVAPKSTKDSDERIIDF